MPEFSAGEGKTAVVQMTNHKAAPFDYLSTLYMGVNMVALHTKEFGLLAGESKSVSFPVTMPLEAGVYPVFLDVWSGDKLLVHYQAIEDVTIIGIEEVMIDSPGFPVAPCYQGETTIEAAVYIPLSACPEGSELNIQIGIPKDCPLLPLYYPSNPDLGAYYDAIFLSAVVTRDDLTSPDNLYVLTAKKNLVTRRYRSSPAPQSYEDWLPANTYPLYMRTRVDSYTPWEQIGNINIVPEALSHFTYSGWSYYKENLDRKVNVHFQITITNSGSQTETHNVREFNRKSTHGWNHGNPRSQNLVSLEPGQSVTLHEDQIQFDGTRYYYKFIDDQGGASSQYSVSV
jgi:hypothetical protein